LEGGSEVRADLNARVRTRDGEDAGKVRYAIFDPNAGDVSHFVVSTGRLFGRDIVVPAESIVPPEIAEDESHTEETVVLNLSKAELEAMPDFDPTRYGAPPAGWMAPEAYGYPISGYVWSSNIAAGADLGPEIEPPGDEAAPAAAIARGTPVLDSAGDDVGEVEDLRFDTRRGELNALVVRIGGVLQTLFGGGETVEVPRAMIASVTPGGVHLRAGKQELENMARTGSSGQR
jgi:sporulation protein YlmC with PRC-barrel domain